MMLEKKRILLFVTSLGIGGAERLVCNLADYYAEQGHNVVIAYLEERKDFFKPKSDSVELVHLGLERNFVSLFGVLYRLRKLIKNFNPDVVHSHMYHPNIIARIARCISPIKKLISTSHSTNEGGKFRMLSYKLTAPFVDKMTAVSIDARDVLVKRGAINKDNIITVPNGIDPDEFIFCPEERKRFRSSFGIGDEQNLILAAGRLSIPKNYGGLLTAVSILVKKREDFKVVIAGDGPLKEQLLSLCYELGLENNVHFLGVYRDMPALLSAADIFVLSSHWEGLPLVVAEAMACQRLVVATDCGGVKEVLGNCGILIEPNDSEILAEALDKAIGMPAGEKIELGLRARARIEEKFSLAANAEAYFELY